MQTTDVATVADSSCRSRSFLPEDIQNILLYWRDKLKQGYFEIGDVAGDVIAEMGGLAEQDIFNEVGAFCGKSGRTVRYYYETARFFPPEVREHYAELPFSHFVFARSMGENWRDVLEYAAERPHVSKEALFAEFGQKPAMTAYQAIEDILGENGVSATGNITVKEKERIDEINERRARAIVAIDEIRHGVDSLRELVSVEGEPGRVEAIVRLVALIEENVPDVEKILEML